MENAPASECALYRLVHYSVVYKRKRYAWRASGPTDLLLSAQHFANGALRVTILRIVVFKYLCTFTLVAAAQHEMCVQHATGAPSGEVHLTARLVTGFPGRCRRGLVAASFWHETPRCMDSCPSRGTKLFTQLLHDNNWQPPTHRGSHQRLTQPWEPWTLRLRGSQTSPLEERYGAFGSARQDVNEHLQGSKYTCWRLAAFNAWHVHKALTCTLYCDIIHVTQNLGSALTYSLSPVVVFGVQPLVVVLESNPGPGQDCA